VNEAQTPGITLEKDAVVVRIARDGPAPPLGSIDWQEQRSRKPRPSQFPRFHDRDHARFGWYGPVLAARTGVPALVLGVDTEAERSHSPHHLRRNPRTQSRTSDSTNRSPN
jgi:hypothetical protein